MLKGCNTNQTHERRARNKKAFDTVIETYVNLRFNSEIKAMDMSKQNKATANLAMPMPIDFCCDVDTSIKSILTEKKDLLYFHKAYMLGLSNDFTDEQINTLEQRLGNLFIVRRLYPVKKYFLTIRKKLGEK